MKIQGADKVGKGTLPPASHGQIALVRGGALGDFVLTLPLVQALRACRPAARLVLIGKPAHARLAGAPEQADSLDMDSAAWSGMYTPTGGGQQLLRRVPDCRLLVACLPGGRARADADYLRNLQSLCTDLRIGDPLPEPDQQRHMTDRLLDPIRPLLSAAAPDARPDPRPVIELANPPTRGQTIVLHPGSGGRDKCWPSRHFGQLLNWLRQRHLPVAVLWGPVEMARAAEFDAELTRNPVSPSSPLELARYLASARLYIGNDTGPGHVAAAVGCPTLSLFGPTDPALWRPLGPRAEVLQAPGGVLSDLTVATVIEGVDAALNR